VASIIEKATGIIATQLRPLLKGKEKKWRGKIIAAIASIAFAFFRKGGFTENLRPTLCNKEKTYKQSKNNNNKKLKKITYQ